jgi:hypothetical protein
MRGDERPRDRHALTLAARELARVLVQVLAEADRLEHGAGAGADRAPACARLHQERHLDVLVRRERLDQVVGLENEADLLPHRFEHGLARAAELLTEHRERAVLRRAERPDQREQRRLPAPRRAGHDHNLALGDVDRDVEEDLLLQAP